MDNTKRFETEDGHVHFHNDYGQMTSRRQWCVRMYGKQYEYFDRYSDALICWNEMNGIANPEIDNTESE